MELTELQKQLLIGIIDDKITGLEEEQEYGYDEDVSAEIELTYDLRHAVADLIGY